MFSRWHIRAQFLWAPLLAVLVAFFCCGLGWHARSQAARHKRTLAQLDLDIISESLQSLSADGATAISPTVVTNLDARILYGLLSATNGGTVFLGHHPEWDQRQELLDPWGHPFHMEVIPARGTSQGTEAPVAARVRIWSMGPNGRDDQGAVDDVTCPLVAIRLGK